MAIRKADVPRVAYYLDDVLEFKESGWDGAEVEPDGTTARNAYHAIKRVLRKNPEETAGIDCVLRKGRVYLMRVRSR